MNAIEQIRDSYLGNPQSTKKDTKSHTDISKSFDKALSKAKEKSDVRFSKHASERLIDRQINLSDEQRIRLNEATDKARDKGLKESLVMVDDLAFIVNVKNNTVVTAVGDTERSVFTNIDGAIIG